MACVMNCSIFVKNAPNYAGLGFGEGYTSFTIASPTGTARIRPARGRESTLHFRYYFRIV